MRPPFHFCRDRYSTIKHNRVSGNFQQLWEKQAIHINFQLAILEKKSRFVRMIIRVYLQKSAIFCDASPNLKVRSGSKKMRKTLKNETRIFL